jgi:hypothetical protein
VQGKEQHGGQLGEGADGHREPHAGEAESRGERHREGALKRRSGGGDPEQLRSPAGGHQEPGERDDSGGGQQVGPDPPQEADADGHDRRIVRERPHDPRCTDQGRHGRHGAEAEPEAYHRAGDGREVRR